MTVLCFKDYSLNTACGKAAQKYFNWMSKAKPLGKLVWTVQSIENPQISRTYTCSTSQVDLCNFTGVRSATAGRLLRGQILQSFSARFLARVSVQVRRKNNHILGIHFQEKTLTPPQVPADQSLGKHHLSTSQHAAPASIRGWACATCIKNHHSY